MRKAAVIVLVLALAVQAFAARRVTVAEFSRALSMMDRKVDSDMAWRIADLELSERLSEAEFARLASTLPGEVSKQALRAVYDESQFLNPPATDLPGKPAPDIAEQRRIMGQVVNYVSKVIPQLPNFLATRTTVHFEDTPQLQRPLGATTPYKPLHEVRQDVAGVSYRNGHEVVERVTKVSSDEYTRGLQTEGIFGAFLGRVLVDAAQSSLKWGRWEKGTHDLAVFDFAVPQEKSHYEVDYCCVTNEAATLAANAVPFRQVVSYHGAMTIDPVTGTILRLVVVADLDQHEPITRSAILVDYGVVEIGGKDYVCPTRSLTQLTGQTFQMDPNYKFAVANQIQPLQTVLDDAVFSQYHVFRSESKILTAENTHKEENPATSPAGVARTEDGPPVATAAAPEKAEPVVGASAQNHAGEGEKKTARADASSAEPARNEEVPPPTMAEKGVMPPLPSPEVRQQAEMSVEAATSLPTDPHVVTNSNQRSPVTFRATTRLVDVGVVAFDKKGKPVTDLKPEDFEIYDNGVKQDVRYLSRAGEGAVGGPPSIPDKAGSVLEPAFSNRVTDDDTGQLTTQVSFRDSTILLIDASHLAFGDLTNAREEMLRFLKGLPADQRVGLYVLRMRGFQVLQEPTTDISGVRVKLKNWMPNSQDLAQAQEEEMRNRHNMEYVDTLQDLFAVNGSTPQGHTAILQPNDPNLRANGDEPGRDTLVLFPVLARHLAAMGGHKTLVWVSSDNVLADWGDRGPKNDIGSKQLGPLLLHAQDALNEAHVSIYPLDASQLEVGGVGANLANANVQMNPGAPPPITQEAGMTDSEKQDAEELLNKSQRNMYGGRASDAMKQDLHPISAEYRELAEATGGRALRRAGDITGELNGIVADGRAAYLLSFTPSLPADDAYHAITVKVRERHGIILRYRTGYLAAKEPESLKARFQEAIWSPRDVGGIGLRATPHEDVQGGTIKLNIAVTDLELEQRGGRWMDKLDIFLVERDSQGLKAQVSGQTLGLRLLPGTYQKAMVEGIDFDQPLESKPADADIRILVVDENSWRIGTVTIPAGQLKMASAAGRAQ